MKRFDPILLIAIAIYTILLLPFINTFPYLDGNIDFVQSYDFFTGGISKYFQSWSSVHPPFKLWLTNILYAALGIHPAVYNILGLLFGILGIWSIYGLTKHIASKPTARISAVLLAANGMLLACGLFAMRDFMMTSLLITAVYFYAENKRFLYALSASGALLTKETGVLLPISILAIEVFSKLLKAVMHKKGIWHWEFRIFFSKLLSPNFLLTIFQFIMPLLTFASWLLFLNLNHQKAWSDWLFSSTADKGTFYTIYYNLITGNFLNPYAYQQWLHLFILNFNWIYWIVVIIGVCFHIRKPTRKHLSRIFIHSTQKIKTILASILFSLMYFFMVLTIQTYTIPRYILPIIPFLLIGVAVSLKIVSKRNQYIAGALGGIIFLSTIVSLFFSIDPISQHIWGTTHVFNQTLYGMNNSSAGNDGVTYNMQYLFLTQERSNYFYGSTQFPEGQYFQSSCDWMLKDPNNDVKAMRILDVQSIPFLDTCRK